MKKKFASLLMAAVMTMSLVIPSFASAPEAPDYQIKLSTNSNTVSMVGNTYEAYKIFDLKINADSAASATAFDYTIAPKFADFEYTVSEASEALKGDALVQAVGKMTNNSDELNKFAEAALKYIEDNNIANDGSVTVTEDNKDNAVIDVANMGYYLVAGSVTANDGGKEVVAACSLNTVAPQQDITIKADAPTIDKVIDDGSNDGVKSNNAAIGDVVKFKITSAVPKMIGYENYFFVVTDTLSKGLTLNDRTKEGFTITVGGAAVAVNDYDLTVTGGIDDNDELDNTDTKIEIVFKDFLNKYKDSEGAAIVITYEATVNKQATIGVVGNPNAVDLTYSNNPNVTPNGDPENPDKPSPNSPTGKTPEKITRTYVTGLTLNKVDGNNRALAGAEFTLRGTALNKVLVTGEQFVEQADGTYWKLNDGTYTQTAPDTSETVTDNSDKYASTTTKYALVKYEREEIQKGGTVEIKAVSGDDGVIKFEGLKAGTYTIEETIVPDGYNKAQNIMFTIDWVAPTGTATDCQWKVSGVENATFNADGDGIVSGGIYETTVQNLSGNVMPSTGGIGTTIFYVLGGLMVAGAGILLVTKRRMGK